MLVLSVLFWTGCEEDGFVELPGEEIDCSWFDDGSNCWRESLRAFSDLVPEQTETGTLAADGRSCAYAGGFEVVFTNPIDPARLGEDDYLDGFLWDFEARIGGDFLMRYREPDDRIILIETSLGTLKMEAVPPSVGITCPDGEQFKVSLAALLQNCPKETIPARSTTWTSASLSASRVSSATRRLTILSL